MDRMKTFGLLALATIAFFIFSNIMINIAIKTSYTPIDSYISVRDNVTMDIEEARATYVNGYIGGKITNQGQEIQQAYLKIDICSKRDVLLGTRYVALENWKQGETKDFRMGFKLTDADYCRISVVNEIEEEITEEQFTSVDMKFAMLLTTVIMLCYFG